MHNTLLLFFMLTILGKIFAFPDSIYLRPNAINITGQSSSDVPIFQINEEKEQALFEIAAIYPDTSGNLSLETVQQKSFVPLSTFDDASDVITTPDANIFWIQVQLKNTLPIRTAWRLSLFKYWCEEVKVYSKTKGTKEDWMLQKAGYSYPIHELDINKNIQIELRKIPNAVSIALQAGEEKVLFIRYQRKHRQKLRLNLQLIPITKAANQMVDSIRESYFTVIFMSMLAIMALYHLAFFFMTRDTAYFYYALYSCCIAIGGTVSGHYDWLYYLFYMKSPHLQSWVFFNGGFICIISYILFTRSFLGTKTRFPHLDKILQGLLGLTVCMALVGCFNFWLTERQYFPYFSFSTLMIIVVIAFLILVTSLLKNRQATDAFYLLGIGNFLIILLPEHLLNVFTESGSIIYTDLFEPFNPAQIGLTIELLIFALGLGYRTRKTAREKQRFQELDKLKSRFFANISHEFRTPLTLILGPAQELKGQLKKAQNQKLLNVITRNGEQLLQLINQLLDLSKMEVGKLELKTQKQDIIPLLKGMVMSFESLAQQRNIQLKFKHETTSCLLYLEQEKIETIFNNLLSNAFKFTEDNGRVTVVFKEQVKNVEIRLLDTGVGIAEKDLKHVFDRFYQGDASTTRKFEGTGIGLALVKELVELHGGTIKVSSMPQKGTIFTILLKKGKDHLKAEEIKVKKTVIFSPLLDNDLLETSSSSNHPSNGITETAFPTPKVTPNSPLLLIVEDNPDVRYFIRQNLEKTYQIIEAENGQEGIEKALEHIPDLIISDVMMPEKNGYELCDFLKNDERTSHIPMIILTAKAEQEEKLQGLSLGADDYLIKPFNTQELSIRVKNLIQLRQLLKERFAQKLDSLPTKMGMSKIDEAFLEKITAIAQDNLTNKQFNVELFAQYVGMSTAQLNRKLRGLLDQSSNQFIQTIRLQRAAILLKEPNEKNIGDIAFEIGFSSSAYFSSCFKKQFGMSPKVFVESA